MLHIMMIDDKPDEVMSKCVNPYIRMVYYVLHIKNVCTIYFMRKIHTHFFNAPRILTG